MMNKIIISYFLLASCFASAACDNKESTTASPSRFILNNDQALDQKTKLTWRRCAAGLSWEKDVGCVGMVEIMSLKQAKHYAKGSSMNLMNNQNQFMGTVLGPAQAAAK